MSDTIPDSDELETIASGEDKTIRDMNATFDTILERVVEDEGHAYRALHANSHGLIAAEITVHDDLPAELGQGVFARPATQDAILRISTNPGDLIDEPVSVPRGMVLKAQLSRSEARAMAVGDGMRFAS